MGQEPWLFAEDDAVGGACLPVVHVPRVPAFVHIERIVLARGSQTTPGRAAYSHRLCEAFPQAEVNSAPETPHNRIDLGERDALRRHRQGKRTLVIGELGQAVRFSTEADNTCPNYWHFSTTGFCPYGCTYCYLAGTPGVWFSPTIKVYVNLPEILARIDREARRIGEPTGFYLGKLQDALALDPLTGYSGVTVPFFARHPFARQIMLTKSAEVDQLLALDHRGHTILSWSLNPPAVSRSFERQVPRVEDRIDAMARCAAAGYPVRAVIMPMIPVADAELAYADFVSDLLERVPLTRLTLGGICSYANARRLTDAKLGPENPITAAFQGGRSDDGRYRYPAEERVRLYRAAIAAARVVRPDLEIALCLEDLAVWRALGIEAALGRCNCVL